jgi:5-formyltetrahydrofolate cyclo-ligase
LRGEKGKNGGPGGAGGDGRKGYGAAAVAIGLGYDFQMAPELPIMAHDCNMDFFLSPSGLKKLPV